MKPLNTGWVHPINESLRIDTGIGVISWAQRKPGYQRFPRIWSDSNAFATPATAFVVIGRRVFHIARIIIS
jgi:hypothetical protein